MTSNRYRYGESSYQRTSQIGRNSPTEMKKSNLSNSSAMIPQIHQKKEQGNKETRQDNSNISSILHEKENEIKELKKLCERNKADDEQRIKILEEKLSFAQKCNEDRYVLRQGMEEVENKSKQMLSDFDEKMNSSLKTAIYELSQAKQESQRKLQQEKYFLLEKKLQNMTKQKQKGDKKLQEFQRLLQKKKQQLQKIKDLAEQKQRNLTEDYARLKQSLQLKYEDQKKSIQEQLQRNNIDLKKKKEQFLEKLETRIKMESVYQHQNEALKKSIAQLEHKQKIGNKNIKEKDEQNCLLQKKIDELKEITTDNFEYQLKTKVYEKHKELQKDYSTAKINYENRILNLAQQSQSKIKKKDKSFQNQIKQMKSSLKKENSDLLMAKNNILEQKKALIKQKQTLLDRVKCLQSQLTSNKKEVQKMDQKMTTLDLLRRLLYEQTRQDINSIPHSEMPQIYKGVISSLKHQIQQKDRLVTRQKEHLKSTLNPFEQIKYRIKCNIECLQKNSSFKYSSCREQDFNHLGALINQFFKQLFEIKSKLQKELSNSIKENKGLQEKLNQEIQNREELKRKSNKNILERSKNEIKMMEQIKMLEKNLKQQQQFLKSVIQQKQKEIEQIKVKHQESLKQNKERQNELKEQKEQIQKLNKTIQQLKKEKQILEREVQQETKTNKTLRVGYSNIETNLEEQQRQMSDLKRKIEKEKQNHKSLARQTSQKELLLKDDFEERIKLEAEKLCSTLEKVFGSKPREQSFSSIHEFICKNGGSSDLGFGVSPILEKMPKERAFLHEQCCKFLKCSSLSSQFVFKHDEFMKNFGHYLPTVSNRFIFVVLFKTKKQAVFGVLSDSLGKESSSFVINLTDMRVFSKVQRTRAIAGNFQNSTLKFGNEEITMKNNGPLEVKITTAIIGERYFNFKREDLVSRKEETSTVFLQAMEIHRICPC